MILMICLSVLNTINSLSGLWVDNLRILGILNFLGWSLATINYLLFKGIMQ